MSDLRLDQAGHAPHPHPDRYRATVVRVPRDERGHLEIRGPGGKAIHYRRSDLPPTGKAHFLRDGEAIVGHLTRRSEATVRLGLTQDWHAWRVATPLTCLEEAR